VDERNWGQLSFLEIDLDKGSGRAIVRNCFEARKSVPNNVGCRFLANLIAGFIGELFNKNVIVKEKSCAAKGDDHCEFKF
jgi:predicted hydrocarbon binding protein